MNTRVKIIVHHMDNIHEIEVETQIDYTEVRADDRPLGVLPSGNGVDYYIDKAADAMKELVK